MLSASAFRSPGLRPSGNSLNETTTGSLLFECEARVKAAWVEFSENVSDKSGYGFGHFVHKSGFAYGWSEANPDSEQNEPT